MKRCIADIVGSFVVDAEDFAEAGGVVFNREDEAAPDFLVDINMARRELFKTSSPDPEMDSPAWREERGIEVAEAAVRG